ncbi:MAG TPA: hypothetical protein VF678_14250 [bacterium]
MNRSAHHPLRRLKGAAALTSAALSLAFAVPAWADEDKDLDLLPPAVQEAAPTPKEPEAPADPRKRIYVESATTSYEYRGGLAVPPPPTPQPDWQQRLSLNSHWEWQPWSSLRLVESSRFNVYWIDGVDWGTQQSYRLDVREAYASLRVFDGGYLDAGRINLKSGVAFGFNPTDFFKTRAVVDRTSQDPADLRENRLGTGMVRAQSIWSGGSVTLAIAPKAAEPSAIYAADEVPSFYPMWDRTNAQQRTLLKFNVDLAQDFSPEALLYREGDRDKVGLNLTYGLGKSVVLYTEWAGGKRLRLADEALAFGKLTGTFPDNAAQVIPGNHKEQFYRDAAVGGTYTSEYKVTVVLEYDYHEAGFTKDDWRNWFDKGKAFPGFLPVIGELWYIRSYAQDQLEPVSQETAMLRVTWSEAFVRDLELTGLVQNSLSDGSNLVQLSGTYNLSDHWTIGAIGLLLTGGKETERGSLPTRSSFVLKVDRYF